MRIAVWTGLTLVLFTAIGFGWLMHMIPPPSPSWSEQHTLHWVQQHQTSILIGAAMCTFFWSFWVTWAAPLLLYLRPHGARAAAHLRRSGQCRRRRRGDHPDRGRLDRHGVPGPGRPDGPDVSRLWILPLPLHVAAVRDSQVLFGIGILRDVNPTPAFPRWVAYYCFYSAVAMCPASFMRLFKTGPLAYDGVLAFWLVAIDFFVWMVVMSVMMFRAISNDARRLSVD